MSTQQLSELRDFQEQLCNIQSGDSFIDSTEQLDQINEGYFATAYRFNWPDLTLRNATVPIKDNYIYATPTRFRKFEVIYSEGALLKPTSLETLHSDWRVYAVDFQRDQFLLSEANSATPNGYVIQNAESAGDSVVVELDTVSGLSVGDEVWINSTTAADREFTVVQSVNTTDKAVTLRLKNAQIANDKLYRIDDIIWYTYYQEVTALSAAGDTLILPDALDFVPCYYAAYLYFNKINEPDRAETFFDQWQDRCNSYWYSHRHTSSGGVTEFSA